MKNPLSKLYITSILGMCISILSVLLIVGLESKFSRALVGDLLLIALALTLEFFTVAVTSGLLEEKKR